MNYSVITKKWFVLGMMSMSLISVGQTIKESTFDFPIKPETEEWNKYNSTLDKINILQIPETTLKSLSTESLLDICLDYPFLKELWLDNNYQHNFNIISSHFNGLQELFGRSNLPGVLVMKNKQLMDMAFQMENVDKAERATYAFKCFAVEFFLIQDEVLNNFVNNINVPDIIIRDYNTRKQYPNIFSDRNNIPVMVLQSKQLLSPFLITSVYDGYTSYVLTTPSNNVVPNTYKYVGIDIVPGSVEYIHAFEILGQHAGAAIVPGIGFPTKKYNCHGYAWHMNENNMNDSVWIGLGPGHQGSESIYWNDSSYIPVPEAIGTIVSYHGDHSAIRVTSSQYKSKWGDGVLATHTPDGVPSIYLDGSSAKNFYIRKPYTDFTGPTSLTSPGTYTIVGLQSGFSVEWTLSDPFYNSHCIQKNYPFPNQCVITPDGGHSMTNATLTAVIKKNNCVAKTLTKVVSAYSSGFSGTYYNGLTTKAINLPYPLYVLPNTLVKITSNNLIGASATHQGDAVITSWSFNNTTGVLRVGMPSSGTCLVTVNCTNGNTYYLPIIVTNSVYNLNVFFSEGHIELYVTEEEMIDEVLVTEKQQSTESLLYYTAHNLQVYNSTTGEIVIDEEFEGSYYTVNTIGWKSGIYIIRVTIGDEVLTKKIVIK